MREQFRPHTVVRTKGQDVNKKTPALLPDHYQHCPVANSCEGHAGRMAAPSEEQYLTSLEACVYRKLQNWYKSIKIPALEYPSFLRLCL